MRNIDKYRTVIIAAITMTCILFIGTSSLKARSIFYDNLNYCQSSGSQDSTVIAHDVDDSTALLPPMDSSMLDVDSVQVDTLALQKDAMNEFFSPISGFLTDISDDFNGGMIDSLFQAIADTTTHPVPKILTEREKKKIYRDSVKHARDSIRWSIPRILTTGFVPDSLHYKRIIVWNTGKEINEFNKRNLDTTFNDWISEYPFYHEDVDVNYLGTVGSPTQNIDFMKRREFDKFKAYAPYTVYSYTPEDMPFYNTKNPYTELGYWGTLFAYKDKEELNVRFLHTQNITPELNLAMHVQRWAAKGILMNEETQNNNFHFNLNYLGDRYVGHAGFIHQNVLRNENGGIQDSYYIRDTVVDAKTVPINLKRANNTLSRNTVFVNHSYTIPLRAKKSKEDADSTDILNVAEIADTTAAPDSTWEGPMLMVGHIGELSRMYRLYTDNIGMDDEVGRNFYNQAFYINPVQSADSTRLFTIENKVFFKFQPWSREGVINNISGGLGHQWNNIYGFQPDMYIRGNYNEKQNNLYVYAGLGGVFRKYLNWGARGKYTFLGYNRNDFDIDAFVDVSFYPFKNKKEPMTLSGKFSTSLKEPDWFSQNYYSNHFVWKNDFQKTSTTKVEAMFSIPKWKFELGFNYALVNNYLYNDTLGVVRQNGKVMNVMSAYLKKNFKVWLLHFDHRILFQYSSDKDILPLPMFTFRFRYYIEFVAVKNALTLQLGADASFNTLYYAPAYNPALGTFQLQNKELIGNNPYIDIFLNLQWKNVSMFLKCINVGQGWPNGDMFSAYHYVKPYRAFKIGIHWPFYFK